MPEKERSILLLRQAYASPSSDRWSKEDALRLAAQVVARFPDDKNALVEAADAFGTHDADDRRDAALPTALALDPGFFVAAAELTARLGDRTAEALQVARRAVATRRSPANLTVLAEALQSTGATEEAMAAAREALRADGGRNSLIVERACFTLHQGGTDAECVPAWQRIEAEGLNAMERDAASFQLVTWLFLRGRVRAAVRALHRRDPPVGSPMQRTFLLSIGRLRLDAPGALAEARRIPYPQVRRNFLSWLGAAEEAARVDSTLTDRTSFAPAFQTAYEATQAASDGRFADAAEKIRAVHDKARRRNYPGFLFSQASFLAEMLLAGGRAEEAAQVWPATPACRCRDPVDHAANFPSLALYRARAMEQLGRRADAVRELDGIIAFWKEADADLPLLVEAKAMRKGLVATSATRPAE